MSGNAFWFAKGEKRGQYEIGLGNFVVVAINAPDDTLASQWAQCCANALNAREAELRRLEQRELEDGWQRSRNISACNNS